MSSYFLLQNVMLLRLTWCEKKDRPIDKLQRRRPTGDHFDNGAAVKVRWEKIPIRQWWICGDRQWKAP